MGVRAVLQIPPESHMRAFIRQQVDGVEVYLPKGLLVSAPAVLLRVQGFWKLSWLRVEGIATPDSCGL